MVKSSASFIHVQLAILLARSSCAPGAFDTMEVITVDITWCGAAFAGISGFTTTLVFEFFSTPIDLIVQKTVLTLGDPFFVGKRGNLYPRVQDSGLATEVPSIGWGTNRMAFPP